MASKHLDNNYIINFYETAKDEYVTTVPSSSISQSVTEQQITESVLNNYTWINATGSSYDEWTIVSGTSQVAELNPNNQDNSVSYSQIGTRVEIRENQIFTNFYRESSSEENNGIAIFNSSSSGWLLSDYINIATSSISNSDATNIAREFTLDGNYLGITALDTVGNSSKLHIYRSSSSGWNQEQILTTASYNLGSAVNDSDGDYAFLTARIKGDTIFANGFRSGNYNRFVAFFKSSSLGGWEFEDEVQTGDVNETSYSSINGSIGISGVCVDFDGVTAILGSAQGDGAQAHHNNSGRVHIFESSSSGWSQNKVGLLQLGLTSSVAAEFGSNSAAEQEYRMWDRFGYKACAVSGAYIVASAQGKNIYNSSTSKYHRKRHSVFILKSSSAGWNLEAQIDDPADNLILSASTQNGTSDTEFGAGVAIQNNAVVINSPEWQSDWTSQKTQGRSYIYVSTSAGGWTLNQTIDNPYSASVFQDSGYSGTNMKLGYNSFGGYANAGGLGYNSRPIMSGKMLVLNAPSFTRHPAVGGTFNIGSGVYADIIYGGLIPLVGSGSYVDVTSTQYNTQSVETITYIESSGNAVPLRLGMHRGAPNLRLQSSTNHYNTFQGPRTL